MNSKDKTTKTGNKGRARGSTKLRLVKNGDLPVKKSVSDPAKAPAGIKKNNRKVPETRSFEKGMTEVDETEIVEKNGIEKKGIEKKGAEKKGAEKKGSEKKGTEKNGIEIEEAIKEEAIKEEAIKEEAIKEETINEEVINEEVINEEVINEEVIKEETIKQETGKVGLEDSGDPSNPGDSDNSKFNIKKIKKPKNEDYPANKTKKKSTEKEFGNSGAASSGKSAVKKKSGTSSGKVKQKKGTGSGTKGTVKKKQETKSKVLKDTVKEKEKGKEKEKEKSKTKTQTISSFTVRKKEKNSWDKQEPGEWFLNHKSFVVMGASAFVIAAVVFAVCFYLLTAYKVTTVYVDGNIHYSNDEVMDMVMNGWLGDNSLYLAMKYKNKGIEGIPFVEKMDVNVLSPDTIRINVYEKALAGYIEYLGRYIYFDKDGIAVESSNMRTKGIPQVTGLDFGYVVLYEALPVEEEEIFKNILNITQLLGKYELAADKIYFDTDGALTLFFEEIRVNLGKSKILDEKMMRLQFILPELKGKKGTLNMENMDEEDKNVTFHADESQ